MLLTHLKRIARNGLINFWRNPVVSLASLLVMTVTLLVINALFISRALFGITLAEVKDKVDVNVYFTLDAPESEILSLKQSVEQLPEVAEVEYVTREVALENFTKKHANNPLIIQAVQEVGDNPLGASLNIKAHDPSQYESVAKFLEDGVALGGSDTPSIIQKVTFNENREVIDRLAKIIRSVERIGFLVFVLFVILAILVTVNTVRLAIYAAREEISVMRLVGARNNYIRGPFMISGLLYGVLAALLVMAILYPIMSYLGGETTTFFGGFNAFDYYADNFFALLGLSLISGAGLGMIASYFAVHRYLNV